MTTAPGSKGGQKEFPMSKNPEFNYTEFCIRGLIKSFQILSEADPEAVALRLYEDASSFSGRDGRSNAAGGQDDIRCLVAAAAGVELEVCAAREIKNALRAKLRRAWVANDHQTIFNKARDFERSASMAVIDLHEIDWCDPHRIVEECDDEGIEIPEVVEEWIEVVCEPSRSISVIGNRSRKKLLCKPAKQVVKSLFEGDL